MAVVRPHALVLGAVTLCLLLTEGAFSAVGGTTYHGRTSQREPISLRVAHHRVKGFDVHMIDRCPDRKPLTVHDFAFSPPMRIVHSRFGGTFHGPNGDRAVVEGKISRGAVRGQVSDHTLKNHTHEYCNGKATFRLHHR